ncbi:hypothetical protein [Streptomyces californicus]|uniref:hypothetical protein n=1 Tax=Streptomyces californicus TaxID=67351 RepID=UPI0036796EAA
MIASPLEREPVPAFVISGVVIFFWALGWDSSSRCTDSHVSSVNLPVTTTVPWADVQKVWADVQKVALDRAPAITLKDGEELGPVAFGGSLLGEIAGYRAFFYSSSASWCRSGNLAGCAEREGDTARCGRE